MEHDDGAAPGFVGLGGESFDAVHQHCAKERGRRACPGHLHWLNRGVLPSEPDSGSIGSSSRVKRASGHHGASTGLAALLEGFNISR